MVGEDGAVVASLDKIRVDDRLSGKLRRDDISPIMMTTDQGKPAARRGRKASGLEAPDSGVAGVTNRRLAVSSFTFALTDSQERYHELQRHSSRTSAQQS
jgi:hypothetical protein